MIGRRPGWLEWLAILSLAACSACAVRPPHPAADPDPGTGQSGFLILPPSYRMVQRVRLNARGRGLDFIGYLAVNGDRLRAVALMEVGGEVFDLLACAGRMSVLKNPGRVPQAALKGGVMRELSWIFAPAAATADPGGKRGERFAMETRIPGPGLPGRVLFFRNGRLFSEVGINSWQTPSGWPHAVPGSFTLKNMHWGYELTVDLLRMDLRPVGEEVFSGR
jgi:hypothetical protein